MSATYHYCLIDILRQAKRSPDGPLKSTDHFAEIDINCIACNGFRIDTFAVHNQNTVLDANSSQGIAQFGQLLTQNKLFHINVELAFDELLAARHSNAGIMRALEKVFGGQALPETMGQAASPMSEEMIGQLQHPMLKHINATQLAELYCKSIHELDRNKIEHDLVANIIGQKTGVFLEQYEGIVCGRKGLIKISYLLRNGLRLDHKPNQAKETYIAEGEREASHLNNSDTYELLMAWLECDAYQMRRCFELDMFLKAKPFKVLPAWVELEIFSFLKYEAKKQSIAKLYFLKQDDMQMQSRVPGLFEAMRQNSEGHVDPILQRLLTETIAGSSNAYSGSAKSFFDTAKIRETEAYRSRMIA